jgi:hypothetical protein
MSKSNLRSYEYNVLCPVCGFQKKNFEMQQRWDGIWVCKEDWEPRNILDLYRNRPDAHVLPFTYPDNDGTSVAPTINGNTLSFANEISRGTYLGTSGVSAITGLSFTVKQFFYNGTVTKIEWNGIDQEFTSGMVTLSPTDTVTVTFTVAPKFIRTR